VVGSLRASSARSIRGLVSELGDISSSSLDDNKIDTRKVVAYNTTSNGLSLTSTITLGTIMASGSVQQKTSSVVEQNSLLHTKTLLVMSTSDFEDVTLELITESVSSNLF